MDFENAKIYGLCLERLRHQIELAKRRNGSSRVVMESYNTGEVGEIADILELYDLEEQTVEALMDRLEDLAYTASVMMRETIEFDFAEDGSLCLYYRGS